MKLFLIRHGQTTANLNQTYAGQSDVPLTETGRKEAEAIRPILKQFTFDRVYSSDLSRALDTQQLALPGVQAQTTPLLREFALGSLVGKSFAEVREKWGAQIAKTRDYSPFGGESSQDVCRRLREFLALQEADPCGNIAAFVHNGIMTSMMQIVLGGEYDRSAVRSNNCAINIFDFDGTKWRLIAWNYMGRI